MKPSDEVKFLRLDDWMAARDAGFDPGRRPPDHGLLLQQCGAEIPVISQQPPLSFRLFDDRPSHTGRARAVDRVLERLRTG
jgi:hypothetical protein